MIYELRQYDCMPGRLPDVLRRFQLDAAPLWNEIGIRAIGFWTTMVGENDQSLTYMLAWESLAERELKWKAFAEDSRWREIRTRTEVNGPLVARIRNSLLTPTAFSALK